MADITAEIDLDSVIDRLLEGELASPKKENMFPSWLFEMFLRSGLFFLSSSFTFFSLLFFVMWDDGSAGFIHVAFDDAGDYGFMAFL